MAALFIVPERGAWSARSTVFSVLRTAGARGLPSGASANTVGCGAKSSDQARTPGQDDPARMDWPSFGSDHTRWLRPSMLSLRQTLLTTDLLPRTVGATTRGGTGW